LFRIFVSSKPQENVNVVLRRRSKVINLSPEQFVLELSNRYVDSEVILINSAKAFRIIEFLEKEIGLSLVTFHRYKTVASLEKNDILYEVIVPDSMKVEEFKFLKFLYDGGYLQMA
jgi:hypothetical protein